MHLNQLILTNFKNYSSASFNFSERINFLCGSNGAGKTSVLDAIHYLCLGKSYFHNSDSNAIRHSEKFFRIEGDFITAEKLNVTSIYALGGKKELALNKVIYKKIADHVGLIPVVIITPDDQLLIDEGSEERRRFLDSTISQINHNYLDCLIEYNKVLQQRNASLKKFGETRAVDTSLLDSYDHQLVHSGIKIFELRKKYFQKTIPFIESKYNQLSGSKENVSACYESVCELQNLADAISKSREKDILSQRTNAGIHRDDLDFFLNEKSLKKFGSQGQKKTFLMAIKFAEFELIAEERNQVPILLLDDLFDKLDEERSSNVLQLIQQNKFGQVFITDTKQVRIKDFANTTLDSIHQIENNLIKHADI